MRICCVQCAQRWSKCTKQKYIFFEWKLLSTKNALQLHVLNYNSSWTSTHLRTLNKSCEGHITHTHTPIHVHVRSRKMNTISHFGREKTHRLAVVYFRSFHVRVYPSPLPIICLPVLDSRQRDGAPCVHKFEHVCFTYKVVCQCVNVGVCGGVGGCIASIVNLTTTKLVCISSLLCA